MIGMNTYFYTFKGGNLYKHNANSTRNNFYGVQYTSRLKSVLNAAPQDNKLFKTLTLKGDDAWQATMYTDSPNEGYIDVNWFQKKEFNWFAFIRNNGQTNPLDEFLMRSINGIGRSLTISGPQNATVISFMTSSVYVPIDKNLSIGDYVYYSLPPYDTPLLGGVVTAVNVDVPNAVNEIVIDATIAGTTYPIAIQNPMIMYAKNSVAESHGVLGHYCVFELENNNNSKVELFLVEGEVMKSFP
jgi:hypothetical protein